MKDLLSLIREISKKVIVESQESTLPGDRYYTKEEVEQLIQQSMEELLNKLNEAITGEWNHVFNFRISKRSRSKYVG